MRKLTAVLFAGGLGALATPALADPAVLRPSGNWETDLTVYLFAPVSTSGTSTVAGVEAELDMNLRDALEVLDFTISGRLESWRENLGIIVDANYLGISDDGAVTGPGPFGKGIDAEVDVSQHWFGLLGAYRVGYGQLGSGQPYSFDLQAGLRYNEIKQTVKISGGPGGGRKFGGTETWWEPVVGARVAWGINDRWSGAFMMDAGGFGVGGNDLAISAMLGADYNINDRTSLKLGWRYYSIDYSTNRSDGKFAYDVIQTGPIIGLTVAF